MVEFVNFIKFLEFFIVAKLGSVNLFFRDFAFLELSLNLLLQHGQRIPFNNESTKIPHTEHGLCPTANLNPPNGFFAANL